jgi:hypothetical protein
MLTRLASWLSPTDSKGMDDGGGGDDDAVDLTLVAPRVYAAGMAGSVPDLRVLAECCNALAGWRALHADNIAVVHCPTGRRTALVVAALLLFEHVVDAPEDAWVRVLQARSPDRPAGAWLGQCYRRFLGFFQHLVVFAGVFPNPRPLCLARLIVHTDGAAQCPPGWRPFLEVFVANQLLYSAPAASTSGAGGLDE